MCFCVNPAHEHDDVFRCLWTRVATLKLFLDFVRPLRQGPEKLRKALENVKLMLLYKVRIQFLEAVGKLDIHFFC